MATSMQDLVRLQPFLPTLAGALYHAAQAVYPDDGWKSATLDARYNEDGSQIRPVIRLQFPAERLESISGNEEVVNVLREMNAARLDCDDRWYGLVLRMSDAGECELNFNYDPKCIEEAG